jgi:hypothetical protein
MHADEQQEHAETPCNASMHVRLRSQQLRTQCAMVFTL